MAYVTGDDLLPEVKESFGSGNIPQHLDGSNAILDKQTAAFLSTSSKASELVSANAYLGARGIVQALEHGADIVICGRVADASPVIGAAWYWYSWNDQDYDRLAGALIAGHLIECSAYVTGGNFCGFTKFDLDDLVDIGFGIAEIEEDGQAVITKHDKAKGIVNRDTVMCQFLYELQGDVYLNSDVKAYLDDVSIEDEGINRVRVSGVRGAPPPPTTKLGIFYRGGYQALCIFHATGYSTYEKWALFEKQTRFILSKNNLTSSLDVLEFQVIGTPAENPRTELEATTSCRVFYQSRSSNVVAGVFPSIVELMMQHFSGLHWSVDRGSIAPAPFLSFYPAIISQDKLQEKATFVDHEGSSASHLVGHPSRYEALSPRTSSDPFRPAALSSFLPMISRPLGDLVYARSGDKGGNINIGFYIPYSNEEEWEWLRSFLTIRQMKQLCGDDWREDYRLERVEFRKMRAVHFVVYGILGSGVTATARVDNLGKGFADFLRARKVDVPSKFLGRKRNSRRSIMKSSL